MVKYESHGHYWLWCGLYAYILMYNRLPQGLVDLPSAKALQTKLTHLAKERARTDQERWRCSYHDLNEIVSMFYGNSAIG